MEKLWSSLSELGRWALLLFLVGAVSYHFFVNPISKRTYEAGYAKGYAEGLAALDWKEKAKKDRAFTTNLCHAWWFQVPYQEKRGFK